MSRNGIIRPNAVNIETTYAPGVLAQPTAVTLQAPDGLKVLIVGGLTKVEQLAGQIASGLFRVRDHDIDHITTTAVNAAESILAECERRTKERQQQKEPK